jgi:uroporphyrinogen decarboxylase
VIDKSPLTGLLSMLGRNAALDIGHRQNTAEGGCATKDGRFLSRGRRAKLAPVFPQDYDERSSTKDPPMTPIQRVQAVLAGRRPDRPPFSFWFHFPPDQVAGAGAVKAHRDLLHDYDLDVLKVMNDNPYPHPGRIARVEDLASLGPLQGDEAGFGEQLAVLSALRGTIGRRVYMPTTLFNAWMILRHLVTPPTTHLPPNLDAAADVSSRWIRQAVQENAALVAQALRTIGDNLARFAVRCLAAGADGIFLSVRDDWVDTPEAPGLYERLVRPTDLAILAAVRRAPFNVLHVCGKARDFRAFAAYPVPALHWADRAAGPAIREVAPWAQPALWGGVDNLGTLVTGTPLQVRDEVADALTQAGNRPIMIAPGCTFDPVLVSAANLRALADAVHQIPSD